MHDDVLDLLLLLQSSSNLPTELCRFALAVGALPISSPTELTCAVCCIGLCVSSRENLASGESREAWLRIPGASCSGSNPSSPVARIAIVCVTLATAHPWSQSLATSLFCPTHKQSPSSSFLGLRKPCCIFRVTTCPDPYTHAPMHPLTCTRGMQR